MKQQCQCAYCSTPIPTHDMYIFNGSIYHSQCGERVRLRSRNPGSFRILDSLREYVELLYSEDSTVIKNIDKLESMNNELGKLIKKPSHS